MVLNYVKLENVRNHEQSEIDLEPSLNIFFGPNGAGKTSILEAISIASFSKSFITNYDQNIVRHGENYYTVEVGARAKMVSLLLFLSIIKLEKEKKSVTFPVELYPA